MARVRTRETNCVSNDALIKIIHWAGVNSELPVGRIQDPAPGTSAAAWTMATGSCDDPWRGVRTDTRVNSLIFSKEGVGERDVLRLSRTDDVITLLRQYGLRCSAAVGMHKAIRRATLLTPEGAQGGLRVIPVLRPDAGRARGILIPQRMRRFEACGTGVALHLEGFPVVSGWDAVRRIAATVARLARANQQRLRRAARSKAAAAATPTAHEAAVADRQHPRRAARPNAAAPAAVIVAADVARQATVGQAPPHRWEGALGVSPVRDFVVHHRNRMAGQPRASAVQEHVLPPPPSNSTVVDAAQPAAVWLGKLATAAFREDSHRLEHGLAFVAGTSPRRRGTHKVVRPRAQEPPHIDARRVRRRCVPS